MQDQLQQLQLLLSRVMSHMAAETSDAQAPSREDDERAEDKTDEAWWQVADMRAGAKQTRQKRQKVQAVGSALEHKYNGNEGCIREGHSLDSGLLCMLSLMTHHCVICVTLQVARLMPYCSCMQPNSWGCGMLVNTYTCCTEPAGHPTQCKLSAESACHEGEECSLPCRVS